MIGWVIFYAENVWRGVSVGRSRNAQIWNSEAFGSIGVKKVGATVPSLLAVDFFAMANAKNKYDEAIVYKLADKAIVADTVSPIFSKLGAPKCFSNNARILQRCYAFIKKFPDSALILRVELFKFPRGVRVKFNAPGHGALSPS
jgi:hypothetical protein